MERLDKFDKLLAHLGSKAGVLISKNSKVRHLFLKRAEHAAYEYIFEKNEDKRPPAVQKEKLQIMLNLTETAFKRLEEGLYSKNVIKQGIDIFVQQMLFSPKGKNKEIVDNFTAQYARRPPGFLVIGPTQRCNLNCKGCYAKSNAKTAATIPFPILDRIITEKTELWGSHYTTWVGGEPTVYRSEGKDILDFAERHMDNMFLMYTNGTLIDKKMAKRMADLGNIVPQVSVEGFEKETDARRGKGVFKKILKAFENMREAGVPFGIAVTPMRHNAELLSSDEFIDFYFNQQKVTLAWVFQYMPIGRGYSLDLMITPEQRLRLLDREREILWEKRLFYVDFWNSGPIGSGCIAAGRQDGYLYIDWNGAVMPCPYYQFSPVNILDVYKRGGNLNDVYNQPFFEAIRRWQDEYAYRRVGDETGNWLRPCPIRDHHRIAIEAIEKYKAKPEDKATEKWLHDEKLHEGLYKFDDQIEKLLDPYWEQIYLKEEKIPYDPKLPFTSSSGIPELESRFS
ncbi:MAG: radical SAM protein [Deltaproteobacteria bacterium]|nr:radical SAM protein [Deltaproteobacteria bacterium]MBW2332656.1 radical SAM protein [Deltaproteobacteria bacterium]